MSDENNNSYSPFWPLAILMGALLIWSSYQLYAINSQRVALNQQYEALAPALAPSQNAEAKLRALVQDLIQTSGKDPYAAQILKESVQAGILHVNNRSSGTNAAPTAPPAK